MSERDLFQGIRKPHVLEAILRTTQEGYPPMRRSTSYDLIYKGIAYPPKYIMSLAGYFRDKRFVHESLFSGGEESACFEHLRALGFEILPKEQTKSYTPAEQNADVQDKYLILTTMVQPPPFFTQQDFDELTKFTGQRLDKKNAAMVATYNHLSQTYVKVEYWAEQVKARLFPTGKVSIVKKPTNQASNFEAYLWAKLYPNPELIQWRLLAYTFTFANREDFCVKIDTVTLKDGDPLRKKYENYLGDFFNSPIVKIFGAKQILSSNWQYLIDESVNAIQKLQPHFDKLLKILAYTDSSITQVNEPSTNYTDNRHSLNTILYGPPGTGKTYNSINWAVAIADGEKLETVMTKDSGSVRTRYRDLVKENKIVFTTFHQSLSYEDFIEGIKPITKEGKVTYEVVPGIFKEFCTEAGKRKRQTIVMDGKEVDLTPEIFEDLYYDFSEKLPDQNTGISTFSLKTQEGYDFHLYKNSASSVVVRAGKMQTKMSISYNELSAMLFHGKAPTYRSYEQLIIDEILKGKSYQHIDVENAKQSFVMIIDEINRGNIAQIFGELITLLEEDKRKGKKHELSVTLPYSREQFSVPSNVYILGTMNTADRSVEALDTALRRRFNFEFMPPDVTRIKESPALEALGVSLSNLFNTLNTRLTYLLDEDHQLGHSYFLDIKTLDNLRDAFRNKIIPLLKEYFYNDHEKLRLVLGKGFVDQSTAKPKFASQHHEIDREVYTVKRIDHDFDIVEAIKALG